MHKSQKLKVIDPDALKSLSFKDFNNSIVTPHETELELMLVHSNKEILLPKLREANAEGESGNTARQPALFSAEQQYPSGEKSLLT